MSTFERNVKGLLGHHDLVDQRDVGLDVEDLRGELDVHGLDAHARALAHAGASSVLFAAERMTTR